MPAGAPVSDGVKNKGKVDYHALATAYELPGAQIKQAIINAATMAALRINNTGTATASGDDGEGSVGVITHKDLDEAAKAEYKKLKGEFSDLAQHMYA